MYAIAYTNTLAVKRSISRAAHPFNEADCCSRDRGRPKGRDTRVEEVLINCFQVLLSTQPLFHTIISQRAHRDGMDATSYWQTPWLANTHKVNSCSDSRSLPSEAKTSFSRP
jgi:hypothetical protein